MGSLDTMSKIISEMIIYDIPLTSYESEQINEYLTLKWATWGIKEKILCWLFPRQYPELVAVKEFRKKLISHYDASDESTIKKDRNNRVSKWNDKKGSNNLFQSISSHRPLRKNKDLD